MVYEYYPTVKLTRFTNKITTQNKIGSYITRKGHLDMFCQFLYLEVFFIVILQRTYNNIIAINYKMNFVTGTAKGKQVDSFKKVQNRAPNNFHLHKGQVVPPSGEDIALQATDSA